jgi:hypothetical protein
MTSMTNIGQAYRCYVSAVTDVWMALGEGAFSNVEDAVEPSPGEEHRPVAD